MLTTLAVVMVVAVVALVAWALQLMQSATDRQEFSLMLAGCMVCSAAVGLATVMVLTLTSPDPVPTTVLQRLPHEQEAWVSLDAIVLPLVSQGQNDPR
jgi:ABC-type glycerol-3-phosphate transport system permease component